MYSVGKLFGGSGGGARRLMGRLGGRGVGLLGSALGGLFTRRPADSSGGKGKFSTDALWNFASLGVVAVAGLLVNLLIARYYLPEDYGVFTQVLAIFVIVGQCCVAGLVFSVQHYTPLQMETPEEQAGMFCSALFLTVSLSSFICGITVLSRDLIATALGSPGVGGGLLWALPGIWCFAVNKALLFFLNGRRQMRAFAIGQAGRVLLYLLALLVCIGGCAPGEMLPVILTVGESVTMVAAGAFIFISGSSALVWPRSGWMRQHISFGLRASVIGLLWEVNTRVDILMLGIFTTDRVVGVYGFASTFAEGVAQFPAVVRNLINPVLARLAADGRFGEIREYVRLSHRLFLPAMVVMSLVGTAALPVIAAVMVGGDSYQESWLYFAILVAGTAFASGYLPFIMIFNQVGRPGWQSALMVANVLTNIVLNLFLIPVWGAVGAAVATMLATLLFVPLTKYLIWRLMDETI